MTSTIIRLSFVALFLVGFLLKPSAQEQELPISLMAAPYEDDNVLLRWIPTLLPIWEAGKDHGYTLTRMTIAVDQSPLTAQQILASKVVLNTNIRPLPENQWDTSAYQVPEMADIARMMLYAGQFSTSENPNSLAAAYNQYEERETRHLFSLVAAESDFKVARHLALGAVDVVPSFNNTYRYFLELNDNPDGLEYGAVVIIYPKEPIELPVPPIPDADPRDRVTFITWNTKEIENSYGSYNIEKSIDGESFFTVNERPYFVTPSEGADPYIAQFRDSLIDNDTEYFYRIIGRTSFGTYGPPSPAVRITGVHPRFNPQLMFSEKTADETTVELRWWPNGPEGIEADQVASFRILASTDVLAQFIPVHSGTLPPNARELIIPDADPVAYYRLELTDVNDHVYSSPNVLVQLIDEEPPAVPLGLTGHFVADNQVAVSWDHNQERDLKGYRLFVANIREANYTQISTTVVEDSTFSYVIDPDFVVDSIYFTILATDLRENQSIQSEPFALARPDLTPPATPSLPKVNPTPNGIEIGFTFSGTADVTHHILERKPQLGGNWTTVLNIPVAEEDQFSTNQTPGSITTTCYIDSTNLQRIKYQYRFVAFDEADNAASSPVMTVLPFDNGLRGTITDFRMTIENVPTGNFETTPEVELLLRLMELTESGSTPIPPDTLNQLFYLNFITAEQLERMRETHPANLYDFLKRLYLERLENNRVVEIHLNWNYDETAGLKDFQLYRSAAGSAMMPYRTIAVEEMTTINTPTEYFFLDEDVRSNHRYIYRLLARHLDGGYSEWSETIMGRVE